MTTETTTTPTALDNLARARQDAWAAYNDNPSDATLDLALCAQRSYDAWWKAAQAKRQADQYCVVYRRGGRDNFTWHHSLPMSEAEAIEAQASVKRGGREARLSRWSDLQANGLPESYE